MLWKEEGASKYLPHRSRPLKHVLLSLPQLKCSLKSEHCGFKAIVPDPHHTHIFVLALHSQCQGVTSTIVSGTRWSLRQRKKRGWGGGGWPGRGGRAQIPLCFRRMSHFLTSALRCFIYCLSADMKPSSLVPLRRPRARPPRRLCH